VTLTELIQRTRKLIDDQTDGVVTNTDITGFLNEGYMNLANAYGLAKTATVSVVADTAEYDLPADFEKLLLVKNGTTVLEQTAEGSTDTGYFISDTGDLVLTPTPTASATVTLTYTYPPAAMSAASDTPLLPKEYHQHIAHYAAGTCKEIDGMLSEGSYWMTRYQEGIVKAQRHGKFRGVGAFQTRVTY
jgi:hypothetical protein